MTVLSDRFALDPDGKLDTDALQRLYDRVGEFESNQVSESSGEAATFALAGLWVPFGGGFSPPRYMVRGGVVYLSGLMKRSSGTAAAGEGIAQVPEGLAPSGELVFNAETDLGSRRVDLRPDRWLVNWVAGSSWISLSGLSYPLG
jgi:hypothetical protein